MLARYVRKNVAWIDCVSPTPSEVRTLMHEFGIEPAVGEELLLPSYRSRAERQGDTVYAILHFPLLRGAEQHPEQEIDFIIGKHFLITVRYENIDPLHSFAKAFEVQAVLGTDNSITHGGHLFAAMMQNLYKALGHESEGLDRRLRDIEEHIFNGEERRMVVQLSRVGRAIHDFRQALAPHQELLEAISPHLTRLFGPEYSYHTRAVVDACGRVRHMLDNLHDSLDELRETNNSLLSTKQNEIMKTLTVLAFVFLPLSFITSLLGMSIPEPLASVPGAFWLVFVGMAILALASFVYFRRKGWL